MKTSIVSPFDSVDRDDLVRCQAGIPETLYHKIFKLQFPNSGAQDRIISSLIGMFYQLCELYDVSPTFSTSNELKAQQILTDLQTHINNLILQKHVQQRPPTSNRTSHVSHDPQSRKHD